MELLERTRCRRALVLSPALAAALLLAAPGPARAHRPQVKTNLIRLDGNVPNGFLFIRPTTGGSLLIDLPQHPPDGALVIDYRLNAGPLVSRSYPLTADQQLSPLGFATADQDKIELHDVRVVDHLGATVAALGSAKNPRSAHVLAAPLVWVVDTQSDVGFTRGGDTLLKKNGSWTVGFDALRSRASGGRLNNKGNYAELEISINDGPWQVFRVAFDVQSGKSKPGGRPGMNIGISPNDRVRIRRVDVFDAAGRKFAMLGVRMGKQGHYAESLPTPAPTPSASPTPTPSPSATPAEPTPEPTAEPTPTSEPTPTPEPTPEPTVEPTPSPEPTPEPTVEP
ncbi:hypothetical protein K2Z84_05905, partial [Candidatus Binatia bacterium]|nr:hypothetical protein [Candidatus Binatia bacterium]